MASALVLLCYAVVALTIQRVMSFEETSSWSASAICQDINEMRKAHGDRVVLIAYGLVPWLWPLSMSWLYIERPSLEIHKDPNG